MKKFLYLIILLVLAACKKESTVTLMKKDNLEAVASADVWDSLSFEEQIARIKDSTTIDSVLSNDIDFINDSLLKGKFALDLSRYEIEHKKNECYPMRLSKKTVYEYDEGFHTIGDLNADGKAESVFVLNALNYCEEGDSYYFTDNKIPRLLTNSECCHPQSIFSIGDIDEDGSDEIAEYYSSCASRYKSINIWTLKEHRWKHLERFSFMVDNGKYEPFKDFHKLYKKIGKNKFMFLEVSDMKADGELITEWKTVTMK